MCADLVATSTSYQVTSSHVAARMGTECTPAVGSHILSATADGWESNCQCRSLLTAQLPTIISQVDYHCIVTHFSYQPRLEYSTPGTCTATLVHTAINLCSFRLKCHSVKQIHLGCAQSCCLDESWSRSTSTCCP